MSDIAYRLLVDMSAKGSLAPQIDKMQGQAKGLDASFKGMGPALSSTLGGALGGLSHTLESIGDKVVDIGISTAKLGVAGFGAATAYGIHLNDQLEKTQVGLAAIFNATGVSPTMSDGMEVATAAMEKMRIHARDLPGELKDLQLFFKLGLTPGLNIGGNVGQLERMSANAMAASATMELPMDQAARELAQLYGGRAGAHNVFGSMLGFSGDDAKKLNAAQGDDRLKLIEGALKKYEASIPVFAKTFEALTSTLKDTGDQTLRRATKPVFDSIKVQLDRANHWFAGHEDQVGRFADDVGRRLDHGFDVGRRKIEEWAPAIRTFGQHAAEEFAKIWSVAKPLLEKLEKFSLGALQSKDTFKSLEHAALAYGGLKAANTLSPIAMPMLSALGEGSAAALGLEGIGASIAGLGTSALIAAPAVLLAAGGLHALLDSSNDFHASVMQSVRSIAKQSGDLGKHASSTWDRVEPWAMKPLDAAADLWLKGMDDQISMWTQAWGAMDAFTAKFKSFLDMMGVAANQILPSPIPEPIDRNADLTALLNPIKAMGQAASEIDLDSRKTKKGAGGGGGGTIIQKVEIVVSTNQDPNRVARLTVDRLMDVSRFPKSSPNARNWSSERP